MMFLILDMLVFVVLFYFGAIALAKLSRFVVSGYDHSPAFSLIVAGACLAYFLFYRIDIMHTVGL